MCRDSCVALDFSTDNCLKKTRTRIRRDALCPTIGVLLRYRTRIVRVIAEARGQRAKIESLDATGGTFIGTVKWCGPRGLGSQLKPVAVVAAITDGRVTAHPQIRAELHPGDKVRRDLAQLSQPAKLHGADHIDA